jgi:hypothetical protein
MEQPRYLEPTIREDLASKMVFLAGPRQVGKTVLARRILAGSEAGVYLNWDNRGDRKEIRAARWPGGNALVVLDQVYQVVLEGERDFAQAGIRCLPAHRFLAALV